MSGHASTVDMPTAPPRVSRPAPPGVGPESVIATPRSRLGATRDGERLAVGFAAAAIVLLPLLKPGGPMNLALVDAPMALAVMATLLWAGMSRRKLRWPYAVPAGLLLAGGALGALAGPVPMTSGLALLQDLWLLAWCWSLVNLASSPARLKVLLGAWAYGGVAWVALLFAGLVLGIPQLTGQDASEGTRTALTTGDPSYAASYLFVSLMIMWATGLPRRRPVRVAVSLFLIAGILSTGSNSGMVSLFVGASAAAVMSVYGRRGLVACVATAAGIVFATALLASSVSLSELQSKAHSSQYGFIRDGIGRSSVSVAQRHELLQESLVLRREGGPFGTGPVSTKPRLAAERAQFVKEAHDDYLASIIERGPLGLLGLVVLLSGLGLRAVRGAVGRLQPGFAAVIIRPHALVGAVAGSAVAMAVYELLHLRHMWALFGLVAAISIWGRR